MDLCMSYIVLSTIVKIIIARTQSGEFEYRGNVSYSDVSLLISEARPDDVSLRYCAAECYKNVDCNAMEICSLSIHTVCRLSKSITSNLVTGQGTCSRYEVEHPCDDDSFFNRRTAKCQCAIDCDCYVVTPPIGGVLPKTVNIDGQLILTNCINTGGYVWTMIQRRIDGSINFFRGWNEYKNGFGNVASEFWIGLDNIRLLVQNGYTVLRVELEAGAETTFAEYSSFYIAGEEDKYRIHVSGYSGTAGYSLSIERCDGISCTNMFCNNDAQFSTYDNDNDAVTTRNEALTWRGAWWYNEGHMSNLNGVYGNNNHGQGVNWYFFKGWAVSLSGARMMLRFG